MAKTKRVQKSVGRRRNNPTTKTLIQDIPVSESLKLLKIGLDNYSRISQSNTCFNIIRIYLSQQTVLVVEYVTERTQSIDLKVEIGELIGFMGGFYLNKGNQKTTFEVPKLFAVTALNKRHDKLMYVISSHDATQHIMKGNAIEWIKKSIFTDTTGDYLLSIAKSKISTIENALRRVIYELLYEEKSEYWSDLVDSRIFKEAHKAFQKATNSADITDSQILDYTYLPQLKTIVENNWALFASLFNSRELFAKTMDELNKIRRDESHNRKISESDIAALERIYEIVLSKIADNYPDTVPKYILDNWHKSLVAIIERLAKEIPCIAEEDRRNLKINLVAMKRFQSAVGVACTETKELLYPVNKQNLHLRLIKILQDLYIILSDMTRHAENTDIEQLESAFITFNTKMKEIKDFEKDYLLSEI